MARKKKQTPEGGVLSACLAYLGAARVFCWRNNSGALPRADGGLLRFGLPGSSDILGVLPGGRFLAVEVKAPGGDKPTATQEAFLGAVRSAGGVAVVARSIDDLRSGLREAGFDAP